MTNLYPTDNRLDFGSVLEGDVFARVYIKQRWADAWVERLDIVATQILWAAAPNTGSATIHRRYGPVVDRGDDAAVNRTPIELGGWYVKIVVTCPDGDRNWHGYVIDIGDEPGGLVKVGTTTYATGKQTWQCVGMLAALDRDVLKDHLSHALSSIDDPDKLDRRTIFSPPHFNPSVTVNTGLITRFKQQPNRKTDANVFAANNYIGGTGNIVRFWTRREIVQYLVETAAPVDEGSDLIIPLRVESLTQVPNWGRPELDCENRTLKQALDSILNNATGMGYWVWVEANAIPEEPDTIVVQFYTTTPTLITIDPIEPLELAATQHITDLYCGNDPATAHTVQQSLSTRYNRVRAVGAKRITVLSREFIDSTWERGYTDAEIQSWIDKFPTSTTNTLEKQQQMIHALEEGRFYHLFRAFRMRLLELRSNYSKPGTPKPPVFKQDADPAIAYMPSRYGIRILPDLPLKRSIDYTAANADDLHRASTMPQRDIAIYGLQQAFGSTSPPANTSTPNDWANRAHVNLYYNSSRPNYEINPQPYDDGDYIGLQMDVSGAWQGVMSGSDLNSFSGFTNPYNFIPIIDRTTLKVTLAIEEDRRCESLYPEDVIDLPDVDALLELRLEAGEGFRRVDLLAGTIVGYTETDWQRVPDDITLEDDSDELWTVARLAYEWYSTARSILRLTSRRPTAKLWPGVLIRELNPELTPIARDVNTTITEIALSLPTAPGVTTAAPQFEIVTGSGDIDFVRYIPRIRT